MYGVPDNTDWSFLADRELMQVCIGLHQVLLKFDGDVLISVECAFDHMSARMKSSSASALPGKATSLVSLLGARIAGVVRRDAKTLSIAFNNNERLEIHDSNESFESFQMIGGETQIIV